MFTPMNEHLLKCYNLVLVHKLHSLGIGKLPDPILRAWYYAICLLYTSDAADEEDSVDR